LTYTRTLESGEVHVWSATIEAGFDDASNGLLALLDELERERYRRYLRPGDRARFIVGCAVAKLAIAEYSGAAPGEVRFDRSCPRCPRQHGKPTLRGRSGTDVDFSVSHSGDVVVVACARGRKVGVDVEQLGGRSRQAIGDSLAPEELSDLDRLPTWQQDHAALVYWTRKEAVTKAAGVGHLVDFRDVIVARATQPARLVHWPVESPADGVHLVDLDPPTGYVGSLAVIGVSAVIVDVDASDALRRARNR
jgi:4'-phosphopantetheinyl transferase